jgi:hypothetical protein
MDRWLAVPDARGREPRAQRGSLVRPEFCFRKSSTFAGYGFVVETVHGPLFLTALHVLDEIIKTKGIDASPDSLNYTGRELPAVVEQVNLYDVFEKKWMFHVVGRCKRMYVLPDARVGDDEPISHRDIAAFPVHEGTSIRTIPLALRSPDVGEPVWLATKEAQCCKAIVVEKTARTLVFRYAVTGGLPKHSSGAPIVDENGHAVAINVGTGTFSGRLLGHGNQVESIRRHLTLVT